jgi:hypothetical protein
MPSFLRMIDKSDKYKIERKDFFSLPYRLLVIGRTGAGKSNILGCLLLLKDMYRGVFQPEDIYIFSGSLQGDRKLQTIIKELDVPTENLFNSYNDAVLSEVYDILVDEYKEAVDDKTIPTQKLIVFDDISFDGSLKGQSRSPMINKLFMNGRKFLISTIVTAQKYSDISTGARENASGVVLFKSTNKQLELIEQDMNYLDNKKDFYKMVKDHTSNDYDFMLMDFQRQPYYRDKEYKPI